MGDSYYKTSLRIGALQKTAARHELGMHTTDDKTLHEEMVEYFVSEIARYAVEYQRLNIENQMHQENEDYLLSEISNIVSSHSRKEAEVNIMIEKVYEEPRARALQELYNKVEENEELEERLRSLIEQNTSIQRYVTTLLKENVKLILECNNLKEDHDDKLKEEYEGVILDKVELNSLRNEFARLKDVEELEERLRSLIEQKTSIHRCVTTLQEDTAKLILECNNHQGDHDKLKEEYEGAILDKDVLQVELNSLKNDFNRRKDDEELDERLRSLIEQNTSIQRCVTTLLEENAKLMVKCNNLKEDRDNKLKEDFEGAILDKDALQVELNSLKNDFARRKDDEELDERLISLIEQNTSVQRCVTTLQEDNTKLILEFNNLKEDHDKLKEEYEGTIREKDVLMIELNSLKNDFARRKDDEELEERLRSLTEQNTSIQRRVTTLQEDNAKLILECNNHQEDRDKLKEKYEGAVGDKDVLQVEQNFLKNDLARPKEDKGRIAELKNGNDDHVQQIKMARNKNSLQVDGRNFSGFLWSLLFLLLVITTFAMLRGNNIL